MEYNIHIFHSQRLAISLVSSRLVSLQTLVNILYVDDSIIHKATDGNAHTTESHGIDFHSDCP